MRVLDLFSGVGMFAYGMQQAGHEIAAFCEIEPWPRRVLAKHWPDVPIYEDVRELNREILEKDGVLDSEGVRLQGCNQQEVCAGGDRPNGCANELAGTDGRAETRFGVGQEGRRSIDIITGGFPCQDLSVAGKQAGIHGDRSGLFDEIVRLTSELRPRYIVLENVAALLTGDSGGWARYVFGRLAEIGFDAEWHVIPAGNPNGLSAGAPHRRERVWIVAHSRHLRGRGQAEPAKKEWAETSDGSKNPSAVVDTKGNGLHERSENKNDSMRQIPVDGAGFLAYTECQRQQGQGRDAHAISSEACGKRETDNTKYVNQREGCPTEPGLGLLANGIAARLAGLGWLPEPGIGRVATGVPDRVQKLKALGNGLVWQIPYAIGCAINDKEAA